jgi:peptidoglycan hydrolase-like protein with peptidoglycan-binding domain
MQSSRLQPPRADGNAHVFETSWHQFITREVQLRKVTPTEALQFVKAVKLPAALEAAVAPASGVAQFDFDKAKSQALVVGSDIVSFVKGVTEEGRRDIVNSSLLAQLVANKNVPNQEDRILEWYDAYFTALTRIGWVAQARQFVKHIERSENISAHEAIIAVATTLLGPNVAALAVVKATLDALKSMDQGSPWITLFNRESQHARSARFQITLAEQGEGGQFLVTLMAFALNANADLTQVLFFKFQKNEIKLEHASGSVTINSVVLAAIRESLEKKLASVAQNYVLGLPDFETRSAPDYRHQMAEAIFNFEARRDKQGHLAVYFLPPGDGGGRYEVAGINERYNRDTADLLVNLIKQERYQEAEKIAIDFIAQDTDRVKSWTVVPAIEFYLRDCAFNRGLSGAARIVQRALNVKEDGVVGPQTRAAIASSEGDSVRMLSKLRAAREQYERDVAHRDESSQFWKGLVNRWDKALQIAKTFPTASIETVSGIQAWPSRGSAIVDEGPLSSGASILPALRLGMTGQRIVSWQSFLNGQGFVCGVVDGRFSELTRNATRLFQQKYRLTADGVAGRQTLLKATELGFELIEEPADDKSSSNYPTHPLFPPLTSNDQRAAVFGRFDYVSAPTEKNSERIRILGTWERDNIVDVQLPQLRKALGQKAPQTMQFHRLAARQLQGLWNEWESAKLLDRILTYDGSFVPRFVRDSRSTLSNHAFGSAFDINARQNKRGQRPALVGTRGSVRELVPIANKWGFYWGGHFDHKPD